MKSSVCPVHSGILLGLFFDPEDGGEMSLRLYERSSNSLSLYLLTSSGARAVDRRVRLIRL
jgi:hypothetical protein